MQQESKHVNQAEIKLPHLYKINIQILNLGIDYAVHMFKDKYQAHS